MLKYQIKPMLEFGYVATGAIFAQATAYSASISEPKIWLGLSLPYWLGWLILLLALLFGSSLSVHQDTSVDKYIKHPRLKPFYAFGFGFFFTVFGIPLKYPNLTVWELILPALGSSAIGSQAIYYLISIFTSPELWGALKNRLLAIVGGHSNVDDTK